MSEDDQEGFMKPEFAEVWRSVIALQNAVRSGYIKPGRDEETTLTLAREIERLSNELHNSLIAQTELGAALGDVISLLPDPHLDKDKVQAHYVRKAIATLESYSEKPNERTKHENRD